MLDQIVYFSNSVTLFGFVQFSPSSDAKRGFRIQYTPFFFWKNKIKLFNL
ncbi:hypothetical protein GYH30_019330 [Glycine max]|uniref:Uncharacterized protein n=1 Tax=Glycine max TaxID=3847 RepID=K7L3F2_SOYBN|nr:hypothetical protein GYH30_019330 [Glycine max]